MLPFDLRWNDIDGHCLSLIHELYILLENNYIEDNYSFLRFNYIHEFIKLAICSPKWELGLNLGLKFNRSRKINGFISSNFRKIIMLAQETQEKNICSRTYKRNNTEA